MNSNQLDLFKWIQINFIEYHIVYPKVPCASSHFLQMWTIREKYQVGSHMKCLYVYWFMKSFVSVTDSSVLMSSNVLSFTGGRVTQECVGGDGLGIAPQRYEGLDTKAEGWKRGGRAEAGIENAWTDSVGLVYLWLWGLRFNWGKTLTNSRCIYRLFSSVCVRSEHGEEEMEYI